MTAALQAQQQRRCFDGRARNATDTLAGQVKRVPHLQCFSRLCSGQGPDFRRPSPRSGLPTMRSRLALDGSDRLVREAARARKMASPPQRLQFQRQQPSAPPVLSQDDWAGATAVLGACVSLEVPRSACDNTQRPVGSVITALAFGRHLVWSISLPGHAPLCRQALAESLPTDCSLS